VFPVAILAGGLATRLRPITETIPKSLVPVAGTPFIFRQLEYLRSQRISKVVLCVGHHGHLIKRAVGGGERFGLEVAYSEDGGSLLGTGGALIKAAPLLGSYFFVLYGDSFLPIEFSFVQSEFIRRKRLALMTVLKNRDHWDHSNVYFVDDQLREYNKRNPSSGMDHIDYGLGVLSTSIFDQLPRGQFSDLADIYRNLSLQGELAGLEVFDRFYEIGSHAGLKETEMYFHDQEKK